MSPSELLAIAQLDYDEAVRDVEKQGYMTPADRFAAAGAAASIALAKAQSQVKPWWRRRPKAR